MVQLAITYEKFYGLKNVREEIMKLLQKRPMSAIEISKKLHLDRTTVSTYLNDLEKADKLDKRRKGRTVYFGLNVKRY